MGRRSGIFITQSGGYKAFVPNPMPPEPPVAIDEKTQVLLSRADRALARLDGISYILPDPELFVAMYIKKEALLSSQIEGTQASLVDVLEFEAGERGFKSDVEEVINYIKAMNYGLNRLNDIPMSLRLIKEIHAILLKGVRGSDRQPGEFRTTQNWIGPTNLLSEASFIPPPPEEVMKAMGDLEKFFYEQTNLPPLVKCALIHYQFETIHPFLDGNGRMGRLLITFYLCWEKILSRPLLYLSYFFKKYRQEYYDRLNNVRYGDDFEGWVQFFLRGVVEVSSQATETARRIMALLKEDRNRLLEAKISSPLAAGLLDKLFSSPVITISEVAAFFNTSYQRAHRLISQFEQVGILKEITGKRRNRLFVYQNYMDILKEGTQP